MLDLPKLQEQLLTLVVRGSRIDHQPGDHDDWATAACGALVHAHDIEEEPVRFYHRRPARQSDPLAAYR